MLWIYCHHFQSHWRLWNRAAAWDLLLGSSAHGRFAVELLPPLTLVPATLWQSCKLPFHSPAKVSASEVLWKCCHHFHNLAWDLSLSGSAHGRFAVELLLRPPLWLTVACFAFEQHVSTRIEPHQSSWDRINEHWVGY